MNDWVDLFERMLADGAVVAPSEGQTRRLKDMATGIERGHPEPQVRQFSIFLANRVGSFGESVLRHFAGQGVHIVAKNAAGSVDWAIVRMIFSDADNARRLLTQANLQFTECEMLAVEMKSPDALADMAGALLAAELNLHILAYALLISPHRGRAVASWPYTWRTPTRPCSCAAVTRLPPAG